MSPKKGILALLAEGPVVGDGGFLFALEKRGYVRAGHWTPEATVQHPEAVRQLHREFLRAGSDVMQTFTFYSTEDKLELTGSESQRGYSVYDINQAACDIAREVADEGGALVAGGLSCTPMYLEGKTKDVIQKEYMKQLDTYVKNKTDFMICEFIAYIEEMEWALEVAMKSGQPVAASMTIGPDGDLKGVSAEECAVRMAKAGASIVGLNCSFDYNTHLITISKMKAALDKAGLKPYLMIQPHGYHTPDVPKEGYLRLPQFPLALEPRSVTRYDMHTFAREAYKLGVRYVGGCCGIEPHHIRAMAEELSDERGGRMPAASDKSLSFGAGNANSSVPYLRERVGRDYWLNVEGTTGRPFAAPLVKFDK